MEMASRILPAILPKLAGESCPKCAREFGRLRPSGLCPECDHKDQIHRVQEREREHKEREIADLMKGLDGYLDDQLRIAGISRREREATLEGIDGATKKAMPADDVRNLLKGQIPANGWGLIGTTGNGKSMALSAILKRHARAVLEDRIPKEGPVRVDWIRWESWPQMADWLRDHCRSEPERVEARLHAACTAPILVLDDLCAERRTGDYSSEYATGKLDLIVDARYREKLPTWWTANVENESGILAAYGARFVSRLCGTNHAIKIQGEDKRFSVGS